MCFRIKITVLRGIHSPLVKKLLWNHHRIFIAVFDTKIYDLALPLSEYTEK